MASSAKAKAFFESKKEEVKGKMVNKKTGEKAKTAKQPDTSKMPEGLRKHFEKKQGK